MVRSITQVAAFSVLLASAAFAQVDIAEDATLSWAEGPGEDDARVRMFAGEIDGRGVVYAEYYKGRSLWMAVPYTRVFIDNETESNIRHLRNLEMVGPVPDGFAFTADEVTVQLQCTALLWGDATINCTRGTFAPKGSQSCARYFKSNMHRAQCNSAQAHFATPAISHEQILQLCGRSFRAENERESCQLNAYNASSPALFKDVLATCTAAFRSREERGSCMGYALQGEKIDPALILACDRAHDDDKATTDCVFLEHTGVKQEHPQPRASSPTDSPTAPVATNATPRKRRLSGGRIDVASGTWRDLSLRATGGMVEDEPVLWVDAERDGKLAWMQPVDRIVVGKQVRALREVSSLDKVKMQGDLLTFRAVLGGKRLACRVDAAAMFARCR